MARVRLRAALWRDPAELRDLADLGHRDRSRACRHRRRSIPRRVLAAIAGCSRGQQQPDLGTTSSTHELIYPVGGMRRVWILVLAGCGFSRELPATAVDAPPPDAGVCPAVTKECVADVLRECREIGVLAVDTTCNWGCTTLPEPRCSRLDPHGGGATAADLNGEMLVDVSLAPGTIIDGDNGRIGTNVNATSVRPMNTGILNGIDFQMRANNISV